MKLSEIAEFVVEKYPDCCMAVNNVVSKGCREEWYEEYLIDELIDFFSFEIMNMCGCGCPEDTHDMIRIVLNIREDRFEKDIKYEEVQKRYKEELTGSQRGAYSIAPTVFSAFYRPANFTFDECVTYLQTDGGPVASLTEEDQQICVNFFYDVTLSKY